MKILFVDDDHDSVAWVAHELEGLHVVKKKSTVRQAEEEFATSVWPYDLLILDVQIRPGLDEIATESESLTAGLTLFRKFRSRFGKAKVLILTNNLHLVPVEVWSGDRYTRAWDKSAVAGNLAGAIADW